MAEIGKNLQNTEKVLDIASKDADNIIWKSIKDKAKEVRFGSCDCTFEFHGGKVKSVEIFNVRQIIRVI